MSKKHQNKKYLTRIKSTILVLVFLCFIFSLNGVKAASNINQQINYQGKINVKANGQPVANGSYSVVFKIYDSTSANLWTETQTVAVTNGLFSVMLGSITALTSVDFNSANQPFTLGVNFNGDGEMTPRKTLGAVPAAFEAKKLGGKDWASPDAIGTSTANTGKFTTLEATNAGIGLTLSGNGGQVSFSGTGTSSVTTTGSNLNLTPTGNLAINPTTGITQITGSLGIGISPTAYLTLKAGTASVGTAPLKFALGTNLGTTENGAMEYDGTSLFITDGTGTRHKIGTMIGASAYTLGSVLYSDTSGNIAQDNSNLFWDSTNHKLGIGINSSLIGKIHVVDTSTTANAAGIYVSQTGNVSGIGYGVYISKTGTSTTNVGGYFSATGATNNYGLIVASGNVGIGNTAPIALLHLGVSPTYDDTTSSTPIEKIIGVTTKTGLRIINANVGITDLGNTGTAGLVVTASSNTSENKYAIRSIAEGTSGTLYGINSVATGTGTTNIGGYFSASGGTNNYGLVVAAGSVGIGTTSPIGQLQIVNDGNLQKSYFDTYGGAGSGSYVFLRSSRGSVASPTATQNTDPLGGFYFGGQYDTTPGHFGNQAGIFGLATENWNGTSQGTALSFETTANGTTSRSSRMYIDNSGNVGIGAFTTNPPKSKLEVDGSAAISVSGTTITSVGTVVTFSTSFTSNLNVGDIITELTGSQSKKIIAITPPNIVTIDSKFSSDLSVATNFTYQQPSVRFATSSGAYGLVVSGDGTVGVGTAAPLAVKANGSLLSIESQTSGKTDTFLRFSGTNTWESSSLVFAKSELTSGAISPVISTDTFGGMWGVGYGGDNTWHPGASVLFGADGPIVGANMPAKISFYTMAAGTGNLNPNSLPANPRMVIKGNGQIGIGTATPGSGYIMDIADSTGNNILRIQNSAAAANGTSAGVLFAANNSTPTMTNVAGISGIITSTTSSNGDLAFSTTATSTLTEQMRIASNGNVGIGTNSPTLARLQISDATTTQYGLYVTKTGTPATNVAAYLSVSGGTANNYGLIVASGNVGIGTTTPTALLHLAASSGAVGTAPLKFTSGTNLGTPEAGAMEYDGNVFYTSPSASTRGVNPSEFYTVLSGSYTGSNVNTAQKLFNTGTGSAGTITLPAGAYSFEGVYNISRTAGTTNHTTSVLFGGGATISSIGYLAQVNDGTNAAPLTATSQEWVSVATATVLTATNNSATENLNIKVSGFVRISVGGTFIPQFQYSAAPGGTPTVAANSHFRIYSIGSSTTTTVGNW